MQLGFAKGIIKSLPEEKWAWPWARDLAKISEFPFNISATAEASDFKFGVQLGLPRPIIVLHSEEKFGVALN